MFLFSLYFRMQFLLSLNRMTLAAGTADTWKYLGSVSLIGSYAFAREIKQIWIIWTGRFRTLLTVNFLCEHLQGKIPDGLGTYYTDMYINVHGYI